MSYYDDELPEFDEFSEDDEIDNIITNIYNFVSDKKIVLKEIIYEYVECFANFSF